MNDTLKVAGRIGAELGAAKAENEKLRNVLQWIADHAFGDNGNEAAQRASAALSQQAESECRCTMRQRLVGDGCSVCNPELAAELAADLEDDEQAPAQDEQPAVFWVLFDATTPEPYIKKMIPEGFLAFFDHEEDAIRAKSFHPGTDYKRVPYVRQSAHIAALSAVTAERDRLRDAAGKAIAWLDAEQNGSGVGINRRLKLCRDAENSLRAAMDAKEA